MVTEGKSYLEEAWGHGTAWHGVIRGHVAHHWAGRCCCALKHKNKVIKCGVLSDTVYTVCLFYCSTVIFMHMMHWPPNYYRGQCLHLQSEQTPAPPPHLKFNVSSEMCPLLRNFNCFLISVVEKRKGISSVNLQKKKS